MKTGMAGQEHEMYYDLSKALLDNRYSVELERVECPETRWVARFCGDFIGQSIYKEVTEEIAYQHAASRGAKTFMIGE